MSWETRSLNRDTTVALEADALDILRQIHHRVTAFPELLHDTDLASTDREHDLREMVLVQQPLIAPACSRLGCRT